VLIVEDEPLQRRALARIVASEAPGAEVETAGDGAEALAIARRSPPDVTFLDIRMPRMDGLAAAARLRELAPEGVLYVITAHEEFAYARQAVNLGIEEYLLKPVSVEDIRRCLDLVSQRLEAARSRSRREAELRRTLAGAMPLLRTQFARDLCLGAITSRKEYEERSRLLALDAEPNIAISVGLRPHGVGELPPPQARQRLPGEAGELELEVLRRQAAAAIESLAGSLHPDAVVSRIAHDEVVLLVSLPRARLSGRTARSALRRMVAGLFDAAAAAGLQAAVGVGGIVAGPLELWRSYRGAVRARQRAWLLGRVSRRVLASDDLGEVGESWLKYPLLAERGLAEAVRLGLPKEAGEYTAQLHAYFTGTDRDCEDAAAKRSRLLECLTVVARAAVEGGAPAVTVLEAGGASLDAALHADGPGAFGEVLVQATERLLETVRVSSERRRGTLAARAAAYLEGHFPEHVSLTQIADELHVSPFYLSHVFREEMGVTFSEYLARIRIKEAQRLLATTGLSIADVAARVGYREPNYFGRVFKKATGMPPLAWRRRRG